MKLKQELLEHIVDSTAITTAVTPALMTIETAVCGMSAEVSFNSRILGAALGYAGLSYLFKKGRSGWRKLFNITEKHSEKTQQFMDTAYSMTYNFILSPPFYWIAGARDVSEIVYGTLFSTAAVITFGGPVGYLIDLYGELTGLRSSERISPRIRNLSTSLKKTLFVAITATSIALSAGIYSLASHYQNNQEQPKITSQQ